MRGIYESCNHEEIAEIIFIHNNNSTEDYIAYLNSLKADFPGICIKVMCQKRPGVNAAVYEGFYSSCGDYITAIGADMENDPHDVAKMLELAKLHPGAVITASRRLEKGDFEDYPFIKRCCNIAFQEAVRLILHTKQSDITYMFQCTPKELLYKYDFSDSVNTFILALALLPEMYNIPFYEIPSRVGKREHGTSHLKLSYYAGFVKEVLKMLKQQGSR